MTLEELLRLRALAEETRRKVMALKNGLDELEAPWEVPTAPPDAPPARPRAVVSIGAVSVQKGKDAVVEVRLTCPEGIAGYWLNIRHSPRLEFLSADAPPELSVRFQKHETNKHNQLLPQHHSRHLVSFTTDVETGSYPPGQGLVILPPDTVILRLTYRVAITLEPGRYPLDGGHSGAATPGVSRVSWPSLLLDWGSGGIEPVVEPGYVEVTA